MDQTVHLRLYLLLSGRSKYQLKRIFQLIDSWKVILISMEQLSEREFTWRFSSWVFCAGSIFSMKLSELMSKAIKLLLAELVSQCRNIFPSAFSAIRKYIPALTSHSQVIPSHGNPQMRRTLFDGYLFKYCSVKYQNFHQVSEKTTQHTYSHKKKTPEKLSRCPQEP